MLKVTYQSKIEKQGLLILKNYLIYIFYLTSLFSFFGCNSSSSYTKLVNKELKSGKIENNLFLGFQFGMTKDQYFDRCSVLNKEKIIVSGGRNFSPEQILVPKNQEEKKIKMSFFGTFDNQRILNGFDIQFNFLGWSDWNIDYQSPVLLDQIKDSILTWFPGNDFIQVKIDESVKTAYVKIDGNRRVVMYTMNSKDVVVKINNLLNPSSK